MPIYVYSCEKCGNKFDLLQKMSEREAPICVTCNVVMKNVLFAPIAIFKGCCWAKDGYSSVKK